MLVARGPAHLPFTPRDAAALAAGLGAYAGLLALWLRATGERLRITGLAAS